MLTLILNSATANTKAENKVKNLVNDRFSFFFERDDYVRLG